jgi:glutaconyl-CoA/methylmalonyl-CoA decarboxylase subunit delta
MIATLLLQVTQSPLKPAEDLSKMDPWGGAMAVIAMTVVFVALILLYFCFKYLGKYYVKRKMGFIKKKNAILEESPEDVIPAIALALYLYNEQIHDEERTILTIQKVAKTYSPWSSKIYGLRKHPKNW